MPDRATSSAQLVKPVYRQLSVPPTALPELPSLAEIAAIVRRWEADDPTFCKALDSGQLPVQALAPLGVRLCVAGRNEDAAAVLLAAAALASEDIAVLNNLAVALERTGQTLRAAQFVERSLELSNRQIDSWIFLGNLKQKLNDLTGARSAYESALSVEPESTLASQLLGLVLKEQRQYLPAIECFLSCIRYSHATPEILSILGQLFYLTGQFRKSRDAYGLALESDAANPIVKKMVRELQVVCLAMDSASIDETLATLSREDADDILHKSFALLSAYGHMDAARRVAEKRVELFPQNGTAVYLLHAIRGDGMVARSPNEFLIDNFDKVADRFDEHLVKGLGYDIPQKLAAALAGFIPESFKADALDAGCGTGLCGPLVRGFCKSLVGVDLSPKMLEQADHRKIYDRLVCAELTSYLQNSKATFDVIFAADVFIYFGDLTTLAAGIARTLRPGGLLVFSTERAASAGYQLLVSGRFAQDPGYIRQIFSCDFSECFFEETTVRYEANQPVPGNLYVFRRL